MSEEKLADNMAYLHANGVVKDPAGYTEEHTQAINNLTPEEVKAMISVQQKVGFGHW